MRAAALFNRALAYRPDDTQLLAEVAGLARRGRFRRRLASSVVVFLGLTAVGAGAAWGFGLMQDRPQDVREMPRTTTTSRACRQRLDFDQEEQGFPGRKSKGRGQAAPTEGS